MYCKFFNNYDSNNKYYKSEKPSKWYNPETVIIVDDCMRPCCYSSRKWGWNFYGVIDETLRISTWLSVLGCLTYLTSQVPEHKFCIWQFNTINIKSHSWIIRSRGRPSKFEYRAFNFSSKVYKSYILVSINKVSRDKCNGLRNMNK